MGGCSPAIGAPRPGIARKYRMPLPAAITRPAYEAQRAATPAEATRHQLQAVHAAWSWGLEAFAARREHSGLTRSALARRWAALAPLADGDNDEATWAILGRRSPVLGRKENARRSRHLQHAGARAASRGPNDARGDMTICHRVKGPSR